MGIRQCSSAHCSGADAEINEICKQLGWPVNHPVLTRDATGPCTCSCSCLAFGTPVQAGDGSFRAIETFVVGDAVNVAGRNLAWAPQQVVFSQGTTGASVQKYTVLIEYLGTAIAVTSDHLFLTADGTLKAADRLAVGDKLIAPDGAPVPIDSVYIGDFLSGFHHISTSKSEPSVDLSGHLLNTNGVVSADYTVQIFYRTGQLTAKLADGHDSLPVVGSPEYVKAHGPACLKGPAATVGGIRPAPFNASGVRRQADFVPAEKTILTIPDDACRFISDQEAAQKALDPMRRWNDPLSREWTEALLRQHHAFYPDVQYHLDWADDTVNAYAWVENGVRHVALKGGLVRHIALELEGIALVLAHELAHHYGGQPTFPGGLSCEGQADYAGVAIIMRNVWFGEQYINMTDTGIAQMARFFGVPNTPNVPGGNAGCNHPPGACRIATYHAAVSLAAKPICAG
ncbi:Hint domain-containing protein [Nitrospirillum pindoramense]|uniref:Hint domain-containing protein n=1 Tax=Nitrospirillum amazonense TaxID=28077 RepID=A0A560GI20_9PROT|nr:Hint domain-containing protein [Nitrospirillum amazonense]TWB33270.1 hypothetical protein FBZ90_13512 [Nitrospirillum amazonense]